MPLYVQRALEAYPHATPLAGLAAGLDAVTRALPVGSPLALLCMQRLSLRIQQLLGPAHGPPLAASALDLARLLAHLLTIVDLQVGAQSPACDSGLSYQCACILSIAYSSVLCRFNPLG